MTPPGRPDEGDDRDQEPDSTTTEPSGRLGWLPPWATTAVALVVAVALAGLVLRLLLLGDRITHWDEARVGYWIDYYAETGSFAYRRIIHGPFVQHVNHWLFPVLGTNDFTMRLPVALISATLPLSALFFREHLRKVELVAMALFLAVNPVVLYYSRFMRSDLLVATFMFVALGTLVRFYDTRRWRYVYAAAALIACGFASKENAILYVLTWLGALGLLADQALYRPRNYRSGYHLLATKVRAVSGRVRGGAATAANGGTAEEGPDWLARGGVVVLHLVGVAAVFLALSLFFYAPRGAGEAGLQYPPTTTDQVMFWQAVADPTQLPTLVTETWEHVRVEYGEWFGQAGESGEESIVSTYVEYLGRFVRVMGLKAAPMTVLAVFGFAYERYGRSKTRNLVMLAGYCGFVSVLGYPLGTDIFGAWLVVHALVPLSIPAAVGLACLVDWGRTAFVADDAVGLATAAVALLLLGGVTAGVVTNSVYLNDQSDDNYLVQYAQPGDSPRAELEAIDRVARDDSRAGPDVLLFYGEEGDRYSDGDALVERDPAQWNQSHYSYHPVCSKWFNALPLPWYVASSDADADCARSPGNVTERLDDSPPAVIVTVAGDGTTPESALSAAYSSETYEMRTYGTRTTFWVHESVEIDRGRSET